MSETDESVVVDFPVKVLSEQRGGMVPGNGVVAIAFAGDALGIGTPYLGSSDYADAVDVLESTSVIELPAQKMILCTNQAPSEVGGIYNKVEREEDSLSSNSFCIHAIDTREKKIYITFFGAYKPSNDSDYPDIHTLSYR